MAAERDKVQGYKRINFFRGFLTTEHDWNDAERYHVEKRKLHNRLCHAPGVVTGYAGGLKVLARARGDLSLEVQPGYAIDGQGNDIVLFDAQLKTIVPEEYKLPQTIYIVLRYVEELTDFIAYKENLEYKGHRRVLEGGRVELSQTPPDVRQEIELGRILLEKNVTRIRDAQVPSDPRANEIDLRYVPHAGVAGSFLEPALRLRVQSTLAAVRRAFFVMARDGKVGVAHDALASILSASTLHAADQLDLRNVFDVLAIIIEMQAEVASDVEINHPGLAQKKEFSDYRKHVDILKGALAEGRQTADALQNLCAYEQKAAEIILSLFGTSIAAPDQPAVRESKSVGPKKASIDWDAVKVMSLADLPKELEVDGRTWLLVDSIDVLNKESEEQHALQILEAKDSYRSRQKLKYPDGAVVEDVGRAHVGGYTTYQVKNLKVGKDLAIVRRMDYIYGDYELEFFVDGKNAGLCSCSGTDRVNRWRNWPFVIAADLITKDKLTIKQAPGAAGREGRDINMFRYWFYQPK